MQLERKKLEITRPACAIINASAITAPFRRVVLWAQHVVSDVCTRGGGPFASLSASRITLTSTILPQDNGLLISRSERAALLFGTLRNRINTALTSRLRDYPDYSTWDLIQVCNQEAS